MYFLKKLNRRFFFYTIVILLMIVAQYCIIKFTFQPPKLSSVQKRSVPHMEKKPEEKPEIDRSEVLLTSSHIFNKRIAEYNRQINLKLGKNGAPSFLDNEDKKAGEESFKKHGINTALSHQISFDRELNDVRHPLCKNIVYKQSSLTASVIIVFHNEPWSLLQRTIYSVVNRSPGNMLKEVLLIDDCSDHEDLAEYLEYYLEHFLAHPKVQLIRLKERKGLIQARLAGAEKARGDVLVFLDAHIEATFKWLEPLLARIEENKTTAVVPIIDEISRTTFEYPDRKESPYCIYGFSWMGYFMFMENPKSKLKGFDPIAPAKSPTMPGGIFAIDRIFFWDVGSYDRAMEGWGGENLEMSFRIWQCGGAIEVIPCSRIGHVYRAFRPYKIPGGKDTFAFNTARFAHVWMDDYKKLFFLHSHKYENVTSIGDIKERLELKKRLKCKSFQWYLKNVFPEKFVIDENVENYGRAKMKGKNLCLDSFGIVEGPGHFLRVFLCNEKLSYSQLYVLAKNGQFRMEFLCADAVYADSKNKTYVVQMNSCNENSDKWSMTSSGQIVHTRTLLCMGVDEFKLVQNVSLLACNREINQTWEFSTNDIK